MKTHELIPIGAAPRYFWFGILAILILATGLRLYGIGLQSVWYDEAFTARITRASYFDLMAGNAKDNGNPPLYWLCAKLWVEQFGRNEVALRMLPAIAGVLTVAALAVFALRLFGPQIALLAAFLCAVSPGGIELSNEARVYSIVQCLAVLSMWTFVEWRSSGTYRLLALYSFVTTLLCYSHYYALCIPLVHTVLMLSWSSNRDRLFWAGVLLILLLAALPWLPAFKAQVGTIGALNRAGDAWAIQFAVTPIVQALGRTFAWREDGSAMLGIAFAISLITFALPALRGGVAKGPQHVNRCLLLAWWLAPIVLPAIACFLGSRIYFSRYSLIGLPGALMLAAVGYYAMPSRARAALLAPLVLATLVSLVNYYSRPLKDDWRSTEAAISGNLSPDTLVICDTDIEVISYLYYADQRPIAPGSVLGIVSPPSESRGPKGVEWRGGTLVDRDVKDLSTIIGQADSVWLALCVPTGAPHDYETWFHRQGYVLTQQRDLAPRNKLLRFERSGASIAAMKVNKKLDL